MREEQMARFFTTAMALLAMLSCSFVDAAESQVSTNTVLDQEHLAVAQLTNGTIVFAWEDESSGVSQIWFRRYDANLTALGDPVRAHAAAATDQTEPVVAPLTNGFLVVWAGRTLDGSDYGIAMRRFDFNGNPMDAAAGQANTTTLNAQVRPDVAAVTGGGFVIVWDDQSGASGPGADQDVRYRRFSGDGTPIDPADVAANALGSDAVTAGNQGHARVAALANGGFVIVYEDRQGEDILAVRFDGSGNALPVPGNPTACQLPVTAHLAFEQAGPAVSSFSNGAFVVVFQSDIDGTPAGRRVVARAFGPDGVASNDVVLGSFAARTQGARVAAMSNGTYMVAMQAVNVGPDSGSNTWSILAQRANTNGIALTTSYIANTYHPNNQDRPVIAALRDGSYLLAWQSFGQDASRYGVYAQRFTGAGEPGGGRVLIARQSPLGTNFLVTFTNGTPFVDYRLQASANLSNWVTLRTTNTPGGAFQFIDVKGGTIPVRSYRVVTP